MSRNKKYLSKYSRNKNIPKVNISEDSTFFQTDDLEQNDKSINSAKSSEKPKKNVKKIVIFGGALAVLTAGTIVACSAGGCSGDIERDYIENSDDFNNNSSDNEYSSSTSSAFVDSESSVPSSSVNDESNNIDEIKPAFVYVTYDDIIKLSQSYCNYINDIAVLSNEDHQFGEVTPDKLYCAIYLANIDCVNEDTKTKLIENGIISDNIDVNIENAEGLYSLILADTWSKIYAKDDNIIDLSLIMVNETDQKVAQTIRQITIDSINDSEEELNKKYFDTLAFFMKQGTIYDGYDYSNSVYKVDNEELSIGGLYSVEYLASSYVEICKMKGIADNKSLKNFYSSVYYDANIKTAFQGCKSLDKQKTLN